MTLRLLAEYLLEHLIEDIRPRLVFNSSALLDPASRDLISRAFHCRVIDVYGSEEAGCLAWECPTCAGYHVAADMLVVEVLKDGRPALPGEQGEVVITNLWSRAMPFIRYRQGDMVTVSTDAPRCGCRFPLISRIEGRMEDYLVLRSGRRLPPHPFYHCIDPVAGIKRWRILQETAGAIRLELVAGSDLAPGQIDRVVDDLTSLTRGEMVVEVVSLPDIPVDPGRKFRTITSRVVQDQRGLFRAVLSLEDPGDSRSKSTGSESDPADRGSQVSLGTGSAAGSDQSAAPNHRDPEGACDAPSGRGSGAASAQADPRT